MDGTGNQSHFHAVYPLFFSGLFFQGSSDEMRRAGLNRDGAGDLRFFNKRDCRYMHQSLYLPIPKFPHKPHT